MEWCSPSPRQLRFCALLCPALPDPFHISTEMPSILFRLGTQQLCEWRILVRGTITHQYFALRTQRRGDQGHGRGRAPVACEKGRRLARGSTGSSGAQEWSLQVLVIGPSTWRDACAGQLRTQNPTGTTARAANFQYATVRSIASLADGRRLHFFAP